MAPTWSESFRNWLPDAGRPCDSLTHLTGICRSFFIPEFPEGEQSTVHPSPYIHPLSH
ncbi:hypothetical protein ACLB1R_26115 [Escherichia coli]